MNFNRKHVATAVGTFAFGMYMGLGTGFAGAANGPTGFEGQPGNQAGNNNNNGTPEGLKGFEGQPGNQGGKNHNGGKG